MSRLAVVRYGAVVAALAALAIAIRYEALHSEFFADDYAQIGMLAGQYPIARSKLDLFTFSDGTVQEGEQLIRDGFYPWFTDPRLRLSMLRPLGSAMIALDYALFGRAPLGYHVHSAIWWCVLFASIAVLYRRVLPATQALLALLLFAVDDAHSVVLAWIANRSAIVCVAFAVAGLVAYLHGAERPSARTTFLVLLCFSLAFGFGEYALCVLGYVVAYEATLARGTAWMRARRLWPLALPAGVYLGVRAAFGFAPQASGVYVDPIADPGAFAVAFMQRVPVMVGDLVLALRGEYWTFGHEPWFYRWFDLGAGATSELERLAIWRPIHFVAGLAACLVFAAAMRWAFRSPSNPHLRWLSLGSALALIPVIGSFPSSRLLLVPLIGFCALLAAWLSAGWRRARALLASRRTGRALALCAVVAVAGLYHTALATWLTRDWMYGIQTGSRRIRSAVLELEAGAQLPAQHIVLLAAADGSTSMYVPLTRWMYGRSVPLSCYTLSLVPAAYTLTRVAVNAFTMDYDAPATVLATTQEQLLRTPANPLRVHQLIDVGLFQVTVQSLRAGLPDRLLVRFAAPLEHGALRFMIATPRGIVPFPLPDIGESVVVPRPVVPDG